MTEIEAICTLDEIRFMELPKARRAEMCESLKMGMEALRAQAERERAEPLTVERLREMQGEPVFRVLFNDATGEYIGPDNAWWDVLISEQQGIIWWRSGHTNRTDNYGVTWIAYAHKPTTAHNEQ